jgi:hypothetical protein
MIMNICIIKSNVIEYQSAHYIIYFKIRFLAMPKQYITYNYNTIVI